MKLSRPYLIIVLSLMLVLPVASLLVEYYMRPQPDLLALIGKWFTFWTLGVRLFTAGIKQVANPAFTAKEIFHLQDAGSQVIVRELGFANICLGIIGVISVFVPGWRIAAAFAGGLYMGIAGMQHIIKKPAGPNEAVAMFSDLFVFIIAAVYLVHTII